MIGMYPDHVGLTESEKLSSLYPDWLNIVVIPGQILDSTICAEAYWSKYEESFGLFDAANETTYVVAFGQLPTEVITEGVFSPGVLVEGILPRWVSAEGTWITGVSTEAVFERNIIARGVLESCDG